MKKREPAIGPVIDYLRQHGATSCNRMAERMAMRQSTVFGALRKLQRRGLVRAAGKTRIVISSGRVIDVRLWGAVPLEPVPNVPVPNVPLVLQALMARSAIEQCWLGSAQR